MEAEPSPRGPVRRWWRLLLVLTFAALLRFEAVPEQGLGHYDEGAYALTAQAWGRPGPLLAPYRHQHFLSPPLFPGSAALGVRLGLDPTRSVVLLAALWGVLGVGALYALVRGWASERAALVAATLLAGCPHHLLYSRAGFTDPTFLACFLLALAAWTRALRSRSWWWPLLAGVACGLAWNAKYHGWLAMALALATIVARCRVHRSDFRPLMARWLLAAGVAAACFLPWFLHVETLPGGYAAVVKQHATFLKPGEFLHNASVQWQACDWLSERRQILARLGSALLVVAWSWKRPWLCLPALWLGATAFDPWLLLLVGLGVVAHDVVPAGKGHRDPLVRLGFLLLFAVLTPLYTPYPRLTLPLLAALCASLSVLDRALPGMRPSPGWSEGDGESASVKARSRREAGQWSRLFFYSLSLALALVAIRAAPPFLLRTHPGFDEAVSSLDAAIPESLSCHVVGEPAVVTLLRERGLRARAADSPREVWDGLRPGERVVLILGRYATRRAHWDQDGWPHFLRHLAAAHGLPADAERLDPAGTLAALAERGVVTPLAREVCRVGPARWLDDYRPAALIPQDAATRAREYPLLALVLQKP